MRCANCGNENPNTLFDEGDTFYCSECCHRTRVDDGEDDLVVCPVCHHMRDRKALYCQWCNSTWGQDDESFSQEEYDLANEFEDSVDESNKRYFNIKGRRK